MALLARSAQCGSKHHTFLAAARPPAIGAARSTRFVISRQRTVEARATEDKKVLKREEEPEEYWTSKSERKGANPLADPLAIIGLLAIFAPFGILLVAIATGLVDLSVYR